MATRTQASAARGHRTAPATRTAPAAPAACALEPGAAYALVAPGVAGPEACRRALARIERLGAREVQVVTYRDARDTPALEERLAALTLDAYPGVVLIALAPAHDLDGELAALTALASALEGYEVRTVTVLGGQEPAARRAPALALAGFRDLPKSAAHTEAAA